MTQKQQLQNQLAQLTLQRMGLREQLRQVERHIAKLEGALELLDVQEQQAAEQKLADAKQQTET